MTETRLVNVNGFLMPPRVARLAKLHVKEERAKLGPQASPENQFSLLHVTPRERNRMVRAYEEKVNSSAAYQAGAAKKTVQAISDRIKRNRTLPYDWQAYDLDTLLDHPLLKHTPSDLDVQPEPFADKAPAQRNVVRAEKAVDPLASEPKIVWTDDEVRMLTEGILNYSLGILKTRGNASEKAEALEWIWANDIHSYRPVLIGNQIVRKPVLSKFIPFTFAFCCVVNGMDPDVLRDMLRCELTPVLDKLGIGGPHQNKVIHAN